LQLFHSLLIPLNILFGLSNFPDWNLIIHYGSLLTLNPITYPGQLKCDPYKNLSASSGVS
jgi:hypothetical protein